MTRGHCDSCGSPLPGRKKHGFVAPNGKVVACSFCTYINTTTPENQVYARKRQRVFQGRR